MATDLDKYYTIGPDAEDAMKFLRPSTAYDQDATQYADNKYISRDFYIATKAELSADDSNPPHATDFFNVGESANYLYGKYNTQIYRKLKSGGNWTAITGMTGMSWGWSDGGSRICFMSDTTAAGYWTTTEGGATTSSWNTITTPLQFSPGAGSAFAIGRGSGEYNGDVICIAEYDVIGSGDPDNTDGKRIWRSTDAGDNWATVQDCADAGHFHCVGYHAATGYWVAFRGDEGAREVYKSTDNGATWTELTFDYGIAAGQPTDIQDCGDPRYVILGSDKVHGVYKFDMIDDKFVSSSPSHILHRNLNEHIFYNIYFKDGVMLCLPEMGAPVSALPGGIPDTHRRARVYVSGDCGKTFMPWFSDNFTGAGSGFRYISGVADGKVYINPKSATSRSNKMLPFPSVSKRTFILVEDLQDSLWTDDNITDFDTDGSEWVDASSPNNSTLTYSASGLISGNVNFTKAVPSAEVHGAPTRVSEASIPYGDMKCIQGRAYVRGETGTKWIATENYIGLSSWLPNYYYFAVTGDDKWYEVLANLIRPKGSSSLNSTMVSNFQIGTSAAKYPAGNTWDVTFGGLVNNHNRGHFSKASANTAKTTYSRQFAVEDDWTILETVIADLPVEGYLQFALWDTSRPYGDDNYCQYDHGATGKAQTWRNESGATLPDTADPPGTEAGWVLQDSWKWHLFTLENGDNSWITVYLDTAYSVSGTTELDGLRFGVDIYKDGVLAETLTMTDQYAFSRFAQLEFGLSMKASDDKVRFYVRPNDGVIQEYASTGAYTEFQNKVLTETFAGRSSDNAAGGYMPQMCSWVLPQNNKQFDTAMSSSEIDTEMDNIDLEDSPLSTGSGTSIYGNNTSLYGS